MDAVVTDFSPRTDEHLFGYGRCKPSWMQWLNRGIFLFLALSLCNICQGSIVNGFISTSISSLEKRFNLSSAQSGFFSAFYDVAVVLVLIPLSHYGKKCHKGRTVATGMLFVGIGSILITVPHFLAGRYTVSSQRESVLCAANGTGEVCTKDTAGNNNGFWYALLMLSQVFVGIGATPLFTLGISYIDENVLQENVSLYLGAYMAVSTVGPALGFIVGGQFLKYWGDLDKSTYTELGLSGPDDPRWYGAWWIGFLLIGVTCFIAAIPMFGFPKELPEKERNRARDIKHTDKGLDKDYGGKISSTLKGIWNMISNISMATMILMQTVEAFLMNGFITFIPKVFESLFAYSSSQAATVAGLIVIPMGLLGSMFGAGAAKFTRSYRSMLCLAIIFNSFTVILALIFMYYHQQLPDAAVKLSQQPSIPTKSVLKHLPCNSNCNCGSIYNPVCDVMNKISYYSPCYAGCQENFTMANDLERESWHGCKCITSPHHDRNKRSFVPEVTKGLCKTDIAKTFFFVLFALLCFFTFCTASPIENASLRLVAFGSRDIGICLTWFAMRVFGSIPGAVVFGIVIDQSCVLWKEECGETQSCLLYDPKGLSKSMFLFAITIKTIAIVLLSTSAYFYQPPVKLPVNNTPEAEPEMNGNGINKFRNRYTGNKSQKFCISCAAPN